MSSIKLGLPQTTGPVIRLVARHKAVAGERERGRVDSGEPGRLLTVTNPRGTKRRERPRIRAGLNKRLRLNSLLAGFAAAPNALAQGPRRRSRRLFRSGSASGQMALIVTNRGAQRTGELAPVVSIWPR